MKTSIISLLLLSISPFLQAKNKYELAQEVEEYFDSKYKGIALKSAKADLEKILMDSSLSDEAIIKKVQALLPQQKAEPAEESQQIKDNKKALQMFEEAARNGDAEAQCRVGYFYWSGKVGPKDAATAVKWYKLAAEQGNIGAQLFVGLRYFEGEGVKQDYAEALKWLKKPAEQGIAGAAYHVGLCYAEGLGVPVNKEEGMKWMNIAAKRGYSKAKDYLNKKG